MSASPRGRAGLTDIPTPAWQEAGGAAAGSPRWEGVDGVLTSQLPAPNPPEPSCALQLGALQEALEKLQKKWIPPWGKKLGQVPVVRLLRQGIL